MEPRAALDSLASRETERFVEDQSSRRDMTTVGWKSLASAKRTAVMLRLPERNEGAVSFNCLLGGISASGILSFFGTRLCHHRARQQNGSRWAG